ncbi:type II secretion system F family protein [Kineococcus rhizosphaerae]|uniref:Flp pilus assembly protein TadB n=1 Tax=Kineococcus rhizosphaerae TaxID=559628 RepID=A0A2T0QWR0_9ACTN|nr:type II secretion system F family protein [Kineococcus rhizosphaerae]PRY09905.1 Flp pilus assembly protein TadB [Kineococcus rhizosphaerae]
MSPALVAAAGAAIFIVGVFFAWRWARPPVPDLGAAAAPRRARTSASATGVGARFVQAVTAGRHGQRLSIRIATLAAAAVAGWLLTGWPVMVLIAPAAVIWLPRLFNDERAKARIAQMEALEDWTRGLSGNLVNGSGLAQAIGRTARSAPEPIRPQVTRLAQRLRARWSTEEALRAFGNDLDDVTADLAVGALILASRQPVDGLVAVLDGVAETVSEAVRARRLVEIERDKQQSQVRIVTAVALLTVGVIAVFGRSYLAAYSSPVGQIALVVILGAYFGLLLLMRRMASNVPPPRLLPPSAGPKGL